MSKLIIDNKREKQMLKDLQSLCSFEIHYGLPADGVIKGHTVNETRAPYENYEDLVTKAYMNEMGSEVQKGKWFLPERPFLAQSFDTNTELIENSAVELQTETIKGIDPNTGNAIHEFEKKLVHSVQNEIAQGNFESNADSTIDKKGFDHPLVWDRELQQTISAVHI